MHWFALLPWSSKDTSLTAKKKPSLQVKIILASNTQLNKQQIRFHSRDEKLRFDNQRALPLEENHH